MDGRERPATRPGAALIGNAHAAIARDLHHADVRVERAVRRHRDQDVADVGRRDVEVDAVADVARRTAGGHRAEGVEQLAVHPLSIEQRRGWPAASSGRAA